MVPSGLVRPVEASRRYADAPRNLTVTSAPPPEWFWAVTVPRLRRVRASTLSALNGVESPAYSIMAPVISWSWAALATPMAIFVPIVIDASLLVLP
ncbi:hypothetical protein [Mycobacterium europaeum]|uniref:hypothetical protein n=1 Tax=Mycobacterium europaeum TaxID=761804 RepID=UPI001152B6FA|nr:hypothetical protein [Mycobacterium europaeum]